MTIVGPGQFTLAAGEQVLVSIEKSVDPYLVTVSDLINAVWTPTPMPAPGGLQAAGGFTAPSSGTNVGFAILFNFAPGVAGNGLSDFYTVTITGSLGGSFPQIVFGPGFVTQNYFFQVQ